MDSLSGFVLDAEKCSQLSMNEKRELVHQIFEQSKDASEILSSFTRGELLEIICAEMGKKRKYTGFTKFQMIERLMKLVSQNSTRNTNGSPACKSRTVFKRQKITESPPKFHTSLMENQHQAHTRICVNVACKANLRPEDLFCKRCSCCVCRHYDDNKDPSLWLTCGSELLDESNSCRMSCHLKCALTDARTGITKIGGRKLDGFFYCISCGKVNGLMGSWRKQLLIAKEARRVDELCLRMSMAEKILKGTEKFKDIHKTVKAASKLLKDEVGPVESAGTRLVRGLVNRLSCGAEVQKLCAAALEAFDSFESNPNSNHIGKETTTCRIHFEGVSPTSVLIQLEYGVPLLRNFLGCRIWHRPITAEDYPEIPTFIVLKPETTFIISNLLPSTEYICKVSVFSNSIILGVWEAKWTTSISSPEAPSLQNGNQEAESVVAHVESSTNSSDRKIVVKDHHPLMSQTSENMNPNGEKKLCSFFPTTPCKPHEMEQQVVGFECKRRANEADYDFSVRAVKWLEQMGSINEGFRVKFLTWFSLKATRQERKVVSVFVDTLVDDPECLAGQLIHSFTDKICSNLNSASQNKICTRLWH